MGFFQRLVVPDGYQGVLEAVPLRDVVVDVVGRHHGHSQVAGELVQAFVALGIAVGQVLLQFNENVDGPEPLQVIP